MSQSVKHLAISEDDLLEYIQTALQIYKPRPAGFGITVEEYSAKLHMPQSTARRHLKKLVQAGKLKSEKMRDGVCTPVVYYK